MKESSTLKLLPHVVLYLHSFRPASGGTSGPQVFLPPTAPAAPALLPPLCSSLFGRGGRWLGRSQRLRVDDDLDDEVLLDLSVLQPRLVRQQLAGEEPALVGGVDVLLGLQLLLQLPYGVGHAGAETQVFARGQSYLRGDTVSARLSSINQFTCNTARCVWR